MYKKSSWKGISNSTVSNLTICPTALSNYMYAILNRELTLKIWVWHIRKNDLHIEYSNMHLSVNKIEYPTVSANSLWETEKGFQIDAR